MLASQAAFNLQTMPEPMNPVVPPVTSTRMVRSFSETA
jgi:hypothetical protein